MLPLAIFASASTTKQDGTTDQDEDYRPIDVGIHTEVAEEYEQSYPDQNNREEHVPRSSGYQDSQTEREQQNRGDPSEDLPDVGLDNVQRAEEKQHSHGNDDQSGDNSAGTSFRLHGSVPDQPIARAAAADTARAV